MTHLQHYGSEFHQGNIFGLAGLQTSYAEPLVRAFLTYPTESENNKVHLNRRQILIGGSLNAGFDLYQILVCRCCCAISDILSSLLLTFHLIRGNAKQPCLALWVESFTGHCTTEATLPRGASTIVKHMRQPLIFQ